MWVRGQGQRGNNRRRTISTRLLRLLSGIGDNTMFTSLLGMKLPKIVELALADRANDRPAGPGIHWDLRRIA